MSSHALPLWQTSTERNTTLNKCSLYLAPFSTCKSYKNSSYNHNICHPKLICWLLIACKSSSLCLGLCSFLIPPCLNKSAIPIALAASCVLKCLGLESRKIVIALNFHRWALGVEAKQMSCWKVMLFRTESLLHQEPSTQRPNHASSHKIFIKCGFCALGDA